MKPVLHGAFVRKFLEFFPVPKYLRMPSVGISIHDDAVRYIVFANDGKGVYVKNYGVENIPIDTIESGNISKPEALADALKKIKEKTGISCVIASLPEERAYLFKTEIPFSIEEDIKQNIEFKIEENVPVSASMAVFDFSPIDGVGLKDGDMVSLMVTVVPKEVVDSYVNVFNSAGLTPVSFHVESHAVARAVTKANDTRSYLVVCIDKTRTCLSVVSEGVVRFSSTISIGSIDLVSKGMGGFKSSRDESHAFLANDLRTEIKKVYTYWANQGDNSAPLRHAKARNIEKVLICGNGVFEPGVIEQISSGAPIAVEVANVWQNAFSFSNYIPPIQANDSLEYAGAIGLALDNID